MEWPTVPLNALLHSLESGSRPRGGARRANEGVPSLGGEHLDRDGGFRLENLKYVSESYFRQMPQGVIAPWDILLVKDGATTGKVSLVRPEFPYTHAAVNEHVFILRIDQSMALPAYVFYFLLSPRGQAEILRDHRGATIGGISRNFVSIVQVPLPPLSEQRRIVEILDEADRIRRLRAEADAKADRILPALFIKMFGDPAKSWNSHRLEDLLRKKKGALQSGPFGTDLHNSDFVTSGSVLAVGIDNVLDGEFVVGRNRRITAGKYKELTKYTLERGDVLITIMGTVGRVCVFPGTPTPAICTKHVYRIQVDERLHPEYLCAVLRFSQHARAQLGSSVSGQIVAGITSADLRRLQLPVPPRVLQEKFAETKARLDKHKHEVRAAGKTLQSVFSQILHRAFSASLTASWREAHMKELLQEMEEQARHLGSAVS